MFYIVDDHGEALGKYRTRDEANVALERLVERDPTAVDDCMIIEVDANGRRLSGQAQARHGVPA